MHESNAAISDSTIERLKPDLLVLALRHVEHLVPGSLEACDAALADPPAGAVAAISLEEWNRRTVTGCLLSRLRQQPMMYNVISPLLGDPGIVPELRSFLSVARRLGAISEQDYLSAVTERAAPWLAARISAAEFRHLTALEQRLFGPPATPPAPVSKRLGQIASEPPRHPAGDESSENIAYALSMGNKAEPPIVSRTPAASFSLTRERHGTFVEVAIDSASLPEHTVCVYVEVDTDPRFVSPNHVLWPPLLYHRTPGQSVIGRGDSVLTLTNLRERRWNGAAGQIRVPIPVELLILPDTRREIGWPHIAAIAHRIKALGGTTKDLVARAFDYAKIMIWFGAGTGVINSLEVLRLGTAGCGHLNGFGALLLEFCGIRTRGVGGFTPSLRPAYPGAGHSAYEYFDDECREWRYFDPFFDLLLPTPASGLARSECGEIVINRFYDTAHETNASVDAPGRSEPQLVAERTLAQLFVFRRYFDTLGRLPPVTFLEMKDEASYGLQWELANFSHIPGGQAPDELSKCPKRIHVRSRYLVAKGLRPYYFGDRDAPRQAHALSPSDEKIGEIASLSQWETGELDVGSN